MLMIPTRFRVYPPRTRARADAVVSSRSGSVRAIGVAPPGFSLSLLFGGWAMNHFLVSDQESRELYQPLATLLIRSCTEARKSQALALAIDASKSLARRRLRLSQARVRSTTQRRGKSSKPTAFCGRLTISIVHLPSLARAASSFGPA